MEANAECDKVMRSKAFFVSPNGQNVRSIKYEAIQTMYDLTKDPDKNSRKLLPEEVEALINKPSMEYTFTFLTDLFAYTRNGKGGEMQKRKYNPNDIVELPANKFHNKEKVTTTIGRIVWNKIMIDRVDANLWKSFSYQNDVMDKKRYSKYENQLTELLRGDKIPVETFRSYIDHRDWLGLQLHGVITISFTEKTSKTPPEVKELREKLFKQYEKELAAGDIVTANKIEKQLVDKMIECLGDDPGIDLYISGARGDFNNHMKNLYIMRGGVLNPNTGKFEIMKTCFSEGLLKEDFTAASNSVVQGAFPKAVGTADSGYLAKQLMAGMQTEVIDEDGTDCGTTSTIDMILDEYDMQDFQYRYIKEGDKNVLLTPENSKKYIGKKIKLYSPMCCRKTKAGKICEKCAGKQDSKFVGLDSNKIATTLTNLNMKKFHDSTLRFNVLHPEDMLIGANGADFMVNDGKYLVATEMLEFYVPMDFYDAKLAEDMGNAINLFGLIPVGIFKNNQRIGIATLNLPCWNKFNIFHAEQRKVNIPGMGEIVCNVIRYLAGHQICVSSLLEDSQNAQMFLRQIIYGKVPPTIPYKESILIWRKNQRLNSVQFGVPSVIQETILSCSYRYKKDPTKTFASVYARNPEVDQFAYEMASIRRICQLASTFTGITFESFDEMVTTSINRARKNGNETESPLEMLFKL